MIRNTGINTNPLNNVKTASDIQDDDPWKTLSNGAAITKIPLIIAKTLDEVKHSLDTANLIMYNGMIIHSQIVKDYLDDFGGDIDKLFNKVSAN
jgi:hypothetical protein